jgi:hypothetical protein
MKKLFYLLAILLLILSASCRETEIRTNKIGQPVYQDSPYLQDYAIKYEALASDGVLKKALTDRNGVIQILSVNGLFRPDNGHFQHPGTLKFDHTYRPMADKAITDMAVYNDQFVYIDNQAVFSNAWAGKLFSRHSLSEAMILCPGNDFSFMISDGQNISLLKNSERLWSGTLPDEPVLAIRFDKTNANFLILSAHSISSYSIINNKLVPVYKGGPFTCFALSDHDRSLVVGTNDGYFLLNRHGEQIGDVQKKLPWPELTAIEEIDGKLWFGSTRGAFMLREDGNYNYYFGERWMPGKRVTHLSPGPENSILFLTDKGLGQLCFRKMTLEDKAMFYEKQVRQWQIRYGINSNITRLKNHQLASAENSVADSDNLWTAMYLGSQLFRYRVTGSAQARQNCYEAFEAMERMHTLSGIRGLFGRSFERRGYYPFRQEFRSFVKDFWYQGYQGTISWRHSPDPEWDWRGSASSDQTVGQIFAMTLIAEYIDDADWRGRAVQILDDLMTYIVENDLCLIDYNGKPSLWGRWHPQYVNRFDTMVGDRKICSSNIIAFLQIAYHFTGKEIFKEKAFDLLNKQGYLENLMRPFSEIGPAVDSADAWSRMLSAEWNHSDDEMYFLAYWGLYPYAFNDSLQEKYRRAIRDHWQAERPEKNALWNFCYALTGALDFDLDESVWHLKEFPLDMIQYETVNSHRKDITRIEPNFRGQTTTDVLPPDERPELKHNRNLFTLDAGDRQSLLSAGDTFLLPYWMGRFLGVISAPNLKTN